MNTTGPIYLDYNASTPADPSVVEAMLPYFGDTFANPASRTHAPGHTAADAVERARAQVASLLSVKPATLTFTSGATEAVNLAIQGFCREWRGRAGVTSGGASGGTSGGGHIVTAAHEHPAGLEACRAMEARGVDVTYLKPGPDGIVTVEMVATALRKDTMLVSIMWVNNELGTINDVPGIAALCRERNLAFHTDATQAVGKTPVDLSALPGASLLSCSAHKFYGPKGAGVLFTRDPEATPITPILHGGGHERGLRPGTPNVPAIVGMGVAAELASHQMQHDARRLGPLRDRLERGLLDAVPGSSVNGSTDPHHRLYQTTSLWFPGVDPDLMLTALGDIAVSSGSACGSGSLAPSHVLQALGQDSDRRDVLTLRLSLGRATTDAEVDAAIAAIADAAELAAVAPA